VMQQSGQLIWGTPDVLPVVGTTGLNQRTSGALLRETVVHLQERRYAVHARSGASRVTSEAN
jgi:hypothetical protein